LAGLVMFLIIISFAFVNGVFKPMVPQFGAEVAGVAVFAVMLSALMIVGCIKGSRQVLLVVIPVGVLFLVAEGGARLWVIFGADNSVRNLAVTPFISHGALGSKSVYIPHHFTLYNLRPGLNLKSGTKHNNLGMRDHRDFQQDDNPCG